jgi:ADP-ribose pyrophosphatase YjhB (NUDIX family)
MLQKYKVYINNRPEFITDNWEGFCAQYMLIEAAGGLVYNLDNQLLMIFRNGKWDLPKGKLESGENISQCAMREVEEECGVEELSIVKKLKSTYHTYKLNGKAILKRTYWFKMNSNYKSKLTPQLEEGITKVEWVSLSEVPLKLENSYGNIKELFIR